MTDQHYFEPTETERRAHAGPVHARRTKHGALHKSRELIELNVIQREAAQIRSMISDLERIVNTIGQSIQAELKGARIRDHSHVGFPMSARALVARRENLEATIAVLAERLTEMEQHQIHRAISKVDRLG
jgi:hypothetical protein